MPEKISEMVEAGWAVTIDEAPDGRWRLAATRGEVRYEETGDTLEDATLMLKFQTMGEDYVVWEKGHRYTGAVRDYRNEEVR